MNTITLPRSVVEQALEALANTSPLGFNMESDKKFYETIAALRAALDQPQVEQRPVDHDEDLLEQLFWEFDGQRKKTGEERLAFKGKMRFYAREFRTRSLGRMAYAPSVSDDMMNLADRLGSEHDNVDPRAWKHLLVYAPQPQGEQEPVAWGESDGEGGIEWSTDSCFSDDPDWLQTPIPLYTRPQPKREPLTEADLYNIASNYFADEWAQRKAVMMLKDHGIGGEA